MLIVYALFYFVTNLWAENEHHVHLWTQGESILTYISYIDGFTHITRKEPRHGQPNTILSMNSHEPSKVHFRTKPFNNVYLHASQG